MKLVNAHAGMEIGICKLNDKPALYIQDGQWCRIYATFLSEEKAEMFLHKLKKWDLHGGNDG
ncbi:MAG: hypothetical protein J6S50_00540 [Oscillospiraceae bacterium]|nr:hypothetical protein [Oscillospiraceae bacterium]MBO7726989.1 hypothetical protein [Oscillospiraceae bacterium]